MSLHCRAGKLRLPGGDCLCDPAMLLEEPLVLIASLEDDSAAEAHRALEEGSDETRGLLQDAVLGQLEDGFVKLDVGAGLGLRIACLACFGHSPDSAGERPGFLFGNVPRGKLRCTRFEKVAELDELNCQPAPLEEYWREHVQELADVEIGHHRATTEATVVETHHLQIIGRVIRERNRETAIEGEISRKRSTDRGSQAHNGAVGGYLIGETRQ